MSHVAVLERTVVDQIAAGEVVERPASVVKELVENALDAGATSIDVTVADGGRARVRVADDGCGMERADAILALQRHATSKIRASTDLVGVASFGFRGEALPAIASVSQLELETAAADGAGTRLRTSGGAPPDVHDATRRRGTSVTVERLFFNAAARQRFLRSARGEWRGIVDVVTQLALTRRDVRFTLAQDDRQLFALPAAPLLRARVGALWGNAIAERLVDVDDVQGPIAVTGLVERPADVGTAGRRLFLAVNGRAIRNGGIVRAAEMAYRSTIPAGIRPTLLLEVTVPADQLDVNVHPMKVEVRFRDRWGMERAVEQAVRRALGGGASAATFGGAGSGWATTLSSAPVVDRDVLYAPSHQSGAGPLAPAAAADASDRVPGEPAREALVIPPLTQLRRTYLAFEHDTGLVLIDQHSAHERVLYERFLGTLEGGEAPSQRLLFPITLHLGPAEGEAFDEHRAMFERLGFEIEGFGGHTLIVNAVPMPHPRFDAPRCLRDTLDALTGDRQAGTASRHERLAATIACKAAIRAGDLLSPDEMRALYRALARTTLPAHDVHGRSTIVQLSWDEVERRFGRR